MEPGGLGNTGISTDYVQNLAGHEDGACVGTHDRGEPVVSYI